MSLSILLIPLLLWIILMSFLIIPTSTYSSAWDRLTKARGRADRSVLQIMLDHLQSNPDEWSIGRKQAAFPAEGAKQIMLDYDKDRGWSYALSSFDNNFRKLDGHFEKQFTTALTKENNRRESEALLRKFYPNLEGPLLLQ